MKIKPLQNKVYLKIETPVVGNLDVSSRPTSIEVAEVIAVGDGVTFVKKGDKLMFKSWAVDICAYDGKQYHFIDLDSKGICAVIS